MRSFLLPGNLKTKLLALFSALLLSANSAQACEKKGINTACYYTQDNHVFLNISIMPDYWECIHELAAAGNQGIDYSVVVYDNLGNVVGTFPAQANSNPFIVDIGAGLNPPYVIDVVETLIDLPTNTVINSYPWGLHYSVNTKCDKPDPNEISACFKNERQSVYSSFIFQVPAGLYAYCLSANVTPVLYVTTGTVVLAGPVSPASFSYSSLTYNVFPFLDPNTCYEGGLVFRDNVSGVEDPYAYWLSSNNSTNPYGLICNCVSCEAGFGVDQHLHDVGSTDVSFLSYNAAAVATETYNISGSNGSSYTNDGTTSILLPNGTYTVCHTVITITKERCTTCRVVTITGDNGSPSDPTGPLGKMLSGSSLSPNPSSDVSVLAFTLSESANTEIQIINSYGRIVKSLLEKKVLAKGEQSFRFSTAAMEEGLYTIRITLDSEVKTLNLMVRH